MSVIVDTAALTDSASRAKAISSSIGICAASIKSIRSALPSEVRYKNGIDSSLYSTYERTASAQERIERIGKFLDFAANAYNTTESKLVTTKNEFVKELKANYGWDEALAGSNYIGTIYGFIKSFKSASSWEDYSKTGIKVYEFLTGAVRTYKNYKQIGNAVGSSTATAWWFKNITGLKALGRASTAKSPIARFANNLTNKTSPFNAQLRNVADNFTGANGVGKAVTAWGAVALTGILNYSSNKKEQAASNGTMTNDRVIAETITETAIDTALTYGAGIFVGAAVTAVFGTVAAPGLLVVAASGLLVAGVNAGVKALTGKSTTEWLSDTILDASSSISSCVGNAVSCAGKAVGKWFNKLSFA